MLGRARRFSNRSGPPCSGAIISARLVGRGIWPGAERLHALRVLVVAKTGVWLMKCGDPGCLPLKGVSVETTMVRLLSCDISLGLLAAADTVELSSA